MMIRSLIVTLSLPAVTFAAVGPRAKPSMDLTLELLKLPSEVRFDAITRQPDRIYESLLDVAREKSQTMNLRWKAVTSAALLRREKAAPDLMKLSESPEWYLRNASLVGLSEVAPKESVVLARRLVKDPALVVRSAAVTVIGKHAPQAERGTLWEELNAEYNRRGRQSLWIRAQILEILAKDARENEMSRFTALLSEKDEDIQKASMLGLEKITGLKIGRDATHAKAVQLWQNHLSRQPSATLQQ